MNTQATTTAPAKKYNDMTPLEKAQDKLTKLAAEFKTKEYDLNTEIAMRELILAAAGEKLQPAIYYNRQGHKDGTLAGFAFHFSSGYTAADVEALLVAFPPLPAVLAQGPTYAPHFSSAKHAPALEADNFKCFPIGAITATVQPNGYGSCQPKTIFKYYTLLAGEVFAFNIEVNMYGSKLGHVAAQNGPADTFRNPSFVSAISGTSARQDYWGNSNEDRRRLPEYKVNFAESAAADFTPADWAEIMLPTPTARS